MYAILCGVSYDIMLDVAFWEWYMFILCSGRGVGLRTATCLKTVVGAIKGMLPVKYFCSNKFSFLCRSNFMMIISLTRLK